MVARWIRPLARMGCAAVGSVYVLVGILALLALSGRLTGSADEDRMVYILMGVPGGPAIIWGIVIGAAAYVVWRIVEALADPHGFGAGPAGLVQRSAMGLSGSFYGLIAFSAARIALGRAGGTGEAAENEQQLLVAQVLAWSAGSWLVGAAGLLVVGFGIAQFVLVARRSYASDIRIAPRTPRARTIIHALAWYGYAARGVILCVLGYFLVKAAATHDPEAAGDTDTAFDFIGGGLAGDSAFAIVALGTIAYGLFMSACAVWYRFEKAPADSTPDPAVRA